MEIVQRVGKTMLNTIAASVVWTLSILSNDYHLNESHYGYESMDACEQQAKESWKHYYTIHHEGSRTTYFVQCFADLKNTRYISDMQCNSAGLCNIKRHKIEY
jgi:hypothetical protein